MTDKKDDAPLTMNELGALGRLWEHTKGKSWEPRGGTNQNLIKRLCGAGFLKVVNGRSGFEIIPDSMVAWTEAGKIAMESDPK